MNTARLLEGGLYALLAVIGALWSAVRAGFRALLRALARHREIRIPIVLDLRHPARPRPSSVVEVDEPLTRDEWRGRVGDDQAGGGR
jgi:hypothetical protein